ncbi:hypothetical protein [Mameliella sp.]|uniref:hypothetical protein n=1 Tax=Mameliella sp. TaxID=1924940 RepID=UPI003BAA1741
MVNHPELSGDILDGSDPPDFVIDTKAGHKVSVELVEFVNEKLLQEIIELRRKGIDVTSHSSGFYERAQWDEKSFLTKLRSIISKKSTVYEHNDVWIDILLIHTAEPWLFENDVEKWLKNATICGHRNIKRIHFMMAYMPERKPRHPLFQVS